MMLMTVRTTMMMMMKKSKPGPQASVQQAGLIVVGKCFLCWPRQNNSRIVYHPAPRTR